MLLSLGSLGLFIEILSPGLIFPGVCGAISLLLGLICVQTLPINIGFLMLMILGIILLLSELIVPNFGMLGIGGIVAFVLGSLQLFDDPSVQEYRPVILSVSIAVALVMGTLSFVVARGLLKSPYAKKKVLDKTGEAMLDFDRSGHVMIDGEAWKAKTKENLLKGDKVVVVKHLTKELLEVKRAE